MKPCKYCETPFQPKHPKGEFCTDRCRIEWHRREARKTSPVDALINADAEKIQKLGITHGSPGVLSATNAIKDSGKPLPEGMGSTTNAVPPPLAAIISQVPAKPKLKTRPRLWPQKMSSEEVVGRLHKMRDYNATMTTQGTPQYCSTPEFVLDRLAEVGADPKLVSIVFPAAAKPKPVAIDL